MDQKIISRSEAKAQGLKTYFTGRPCKHGHIAPRQVSNKVCRECAYARTKQYKDENWEYERKRNRRHNADYYARNRLAVIEQNRQYYEANKPWLNQKKREYEIAKRFPKHAIQRIEREIERLDDWEEIRRGLITPKRGIKRPPLG